MSAPQYIIREVTCADLDPCFEIESIAYKGDDAATREKIATRIATYPQGFIVLEIENRVAGFINAGTTFDVKMSDEDFKSLIGHDPEGPHVVIMSVVVHPDYQGRGLAKSLMTEFINRMRNLNKEDIFLMCKEKHITLYENMGYHYLHSSASTHGGMTWHEMVMVL